MACERWREMLSAQLDGEDDPAGRPLVDEHLAGCAGCREWLDRAAAVNRLTRTGLPVPDLGDRILVALPGMTALPGVAPSDAAPRDTALGGPTRGTTLGGPTRGRVTESGAGAAASWRGLRRLFGGTRLGTVLLVALAGVGAVQLILGLGQVGGGVAGAHVHTGVDATPGHLWHESAAWNVAVGTGYLFIALRRSRPTGLVPMLTAFVGMLLLLSINDLTGGRVDSARLVSHGFVILGYLLIVALSRIPGGFAAPPGARVDGGTGWRARFAEDDEGEIPAPTRFSGLRLLPGGPLTAEHDDQRAA